MVEDLLCVYEFKETGKNHDNKGGKKLPFRTIFEIFIIHIRKFHQKRKVLLELVLQQQLCLQSEGISKWISPFLFKKK